MKTLLKSKAIFDGTDVEPFAGAILISESKILSVFREGEPVEKIAGEHEILDFGNQLIMPGFIDAHTHFSWGATAASTHMCTEIEASTSEEECAQMIRQFAKSHPEEKRILGIGWFPANWNAAPLPTKETLDNVVDDRPVYLVSADAHSAWLNTKALEECGYTRDSAVSFGEICKGKDGEPNGMLLELEALAPVITKMISFDRAIAREMYEGVLKELAMNGITALSDMTAHELSEDVYDFFHLMAELDGENKLTARLHVYSNLRRSQSFDLEHEMTAQFSSEKMRFTGLKQFIDGVTSTYTGYLIAPYQDKPDCCGYANYEKDVYQKAVNRANEEGFGVRLHCIGDKAVRWGLDIFEAANDVTGNKGNKAGLRNAIEHIESMHPDDIPRFAELGVTASIQPYHLTLDANEKIARIGKERCKYEWPTKSLLDAGAKVVFGTDFPVIGFNPFHNIYSAITRCDDKGFPTGVNPDETITLAQALRAYTSESAGVYGRQEEIGTIEEGKFADLIVVNHNLFEASPEQIRDSEVVMTIFDGKIIYQNSKSSVVSC